MEVVRRGGIISDLEFSPSPLSIRPSRVPLTGTIERRTARDDGGFNLVKFTTNVRFGEGVQAISHKSFVRFGS